MDLQLIQRLFAETKSSLDAFQSTGGENSRLDAHEKALQLARALDKPRDAILKLSFSVRHTFTCPTTDIASRHVLVTSEPK